MTNSLKKYLTMNKGQSIDSFINEYITKNVNDLNDNNIDIVKDLLMLELEKKIDIVLKQRIKSDKIIKELKQS